MHAAVTSNKLGDPFAELKNQTGAKNEELTFKAPEENENIVNPTAEICASASNLLPPSKRDVTINEIASVRKSSSKMSVLSNRTKMSPLKARESDLQS